MVRCVNILDTDDCEVVCQGILAAAQASRLRDEIRGMADVYRVSEPLIIGGTTRFVVRPRPRIKTSAMTAQLTEQLGATLSVNAVWFNAVFITPFTYGGLIDAHGFYFLTPLNDTSQADFVGHMKRMLDPICPPDTVKRQDKGHLLLTFSGLNAQQLPMKDFAAQGGVNICYGQMAITAPNTDAFLKIIHSYMEVL